MELRDFIVTPVVIFLVYVVAYIVRPHVTDEITRRYFFSALTVRIIGALAVGFIYQFYYSGGDTYNYHTHGSRHIWEAFCDSPEKGIKLLLANNESDRGIYQYSSRILFFSDTSSYGVIRIAGFFDLFTFSAYSATAVLFSVLGFTGCWLLFKTFYSISPDNHKPIAVATLFFPSVIFWGSGLLKDTITLSCAGIFVYCVYQVFFLSRIKAKFFFGLLLSMYILYVIKIYILLTLLPAAIVWISFWRLAQIPSLVARAMAFPVISVVAVALAYFATIKASEDNEKYSVDAIARTAQVTAYDIAYWTGRNAGSTYSIGELDGTWQSMVRLAPQAINVSLFRPYLWEVRNPLMLLSAVESFALFFLTLYVIFKARLALFRALANPTVLFCLIFSIAFAFAVGVATFNFGTLTRYKIPLLPFYAVALILIADYSNRERKLRALESTE